MSIYNITSTNNNVIADQAFMDANYPGNYTYVGEEPVYPAINEWWIYVGPFYDRFGDQKIPILTSSDLTVQAIVKDTQVRKYIDLKRADVASAIDALIAKGFTLDKTAILTTPVPMEDRYTG